MSALAIYAGMVMAAAVVFAVAATIRERLWTRRIDSIKTAEPSREEPK